MIYPSTLVIMRNERSNVFLNAIIHCDHNNKKNYVVSKNKLSHKAIFICRFVDLDTNIDGVKVVFLYQICNMFFQINPYGNIIKL